MRKMGPKILFDYVPTVYLFSGRKIYCQDPTTEAFEIKQMLKYQNKI